MAVTAPCRRTRHLIHIPSRHCKGNNNLLHINIASQGHGGSFILPLPSNPTAQSAAAVKAGTATETRSGAHGRQRGPGSPGDTAAGLRVGPASHGHGRAGRARARPAVPPEVSRADRSAEGAGSAARHRPQPSARPAGWG